MTFDDLTAGQSVFVDANTFLYYFTAHPRYGAACQALLDRIANKELAGFSSASILGEVAHRLMTIEACQRYNWPPRGIARRLRHHPAEVMQLVRPGQAIDEIALIGVDVLPVTRGEVSLAADVSRQTGLLSGDALVTTVMRAKGLTAIASEDPDFDRVPGLTRYAPA